MVRVAHSDFNKFGACNLCVCVCVCVCVCERERERERECMLVYVLVPLSDNTVLYHNLQTQEQYLKYADVCNLD